LCQRWAEQGFQETTDPAEKSRRSELNAAYATIVDELDRRFRRGKGDAVANACR
jgi:hypothetical protein